MKNKAIYYLFGGVLLLAISYIGYTSINKEKVGYVDLQKLYNEFELKKELETSLLSYDNMSNSELDSLSNTMNHLKYQIDQHHFDRDIQLYDQLSRTYVAKQDFINQQREKLSDEFDAQVWQQLNQYILDFSNENGYDFVFGGNGDGSVMYAAPKYDITEKLIQYSNEKYNGK